MGCGCACSSKSLTDDQKNVLDAMEKHQKPCSSKDIAGITGRDAKLVSKDISSLKKLGYVDSPVRCKYGITDSGRKVVAE